MRTDGDRADRRISTGFSTFVVGTGVAYGGSQLGSVVLLIVGCGAALVGLGYAVWAMIAKRRSRPRG